MAIYTLFTHRKWWFSIIMLVSQRVPQGLAKVGCTWLHKWMEKGMSSLFWRCWHLCSPLEKTREVDEVVHFAARTPKAPFPSQRVLLPSTWVLMGYTPQMVILILGKSWLSSTCLGCLPKFQVPNPWEIFKLYIYIHTHQISLVVYGIQYTQTWQFKSL